MGEVGEGSPEKEDGSTICRAHASSVSFGPTERYGPFFNLPHPRTSHQLAPIPSASYLLPPLPAPTRQSTSTTFSPSPLSFGLFTALLIRLQRSHCLLRSLFATYVLSLLSRTHNTARRISTSSRLICMFPSMTCASMLSHSSDPPSHISFCRTYTASSFTKSSLTMADAINAANALASVGQNGYDNSDRQSGMPPPPQPALGLNIPANTNPLPQESQLITSPGGTVSRAAPEPNKRALYVGGLDPRVTEEVLKQIFETTGHVQNVKIIPDKNVSTSLRAEVMWR